MKKVFYIAKALLLSRLNSIAKRKTYRTILIPLIFAVAILAFYLIQKLAIYLFGLRLEFLPDLPLYVLNLAVLSMFVFLFLGSITTILSVFYISNDITLLLSMPIGGKKIFAGKFLYVIAEDSIYSLVFVFPFFTAFGIVNKLGILYSLLSFLFCIALPVLPATFAFLTVMPLASKVSSEKLQNISMVISVLLGMLVYFLTQIANPAYGLFKNNHITGIGIKFLLISRISPSWIASEFSAKFIQGSAFAGSIIAFTFIVVNILLFYLSYALASRHYINSLFNVRQTERVVVKSESVIRIGRSVMGALVGKDLKVLMRDTKVKVLLLSNLAYLAFFAVAFVFMPSKSNQSISFSSIIFLLMMYVIVDYFLCGQNTLINLFIDRESIWVILTSPLKSAVFYWSKFIPPFALGIIVNFLLLMLSVILMGVKASYIVIISLPVVIAMPFIFTVTALFIGFQFPNFHTPKDPRKLISGRVALVLAVVYFVYILIFGVGIPVLLNFIAKVKGISFAFLVSLIIFSIVSIGGGFPLVMLSIRKYESLQVAE